MLKEDLIVLLDLQAINEIADVYSKARRYAKSVHSDANPEKYSEWILFEPAWDVIKKLHAQKRSFDDYSYELERIKWRKSDTSTRPTYSDQQPKYQKASSTSGQTKQTPPRAPKRGSDIFLRETIKFDDLVYGCLLIVKTPQKSAFFNSHIPVQPLEIIVPPTPVSFNKNGSVSQSSFNKIFNKKIRVSGAGEKGSDGGRAGDLIIEFDLDFDNAGKSIYEIINKYMGVQYGHTFLQKSPSPLAPFLGLAMIIGSLLALNAESTFQSFLGVAGFFGGFIYLFSSLLD